MTHHRLDRGEVLRKPTKLSNGWLRVDGRLTRTGVFTYRLPDGKTRRELRLPEEVFKADAMQSFALVPITDEHPPAFLDASNTKEYSRGAVAGTLRQDGKFVAGEMLITDADLIAKLEGGKAREISCGYTCDLEEASGEHEGDRYDAIQRNIRGNHVAIVEKGRAGPEARVRLDAAVEVADGDDDQPRDESGGKPAATLKAGALQQSGLSENDRKFITNRIQSFYAKEAPAAPSVRTPAWQPVVNTGPDQPPLGASMPAPLNRVVSLKTPTAAMKEQRAKAKKPVAGRATMNPKMPWSDS